MREGREGKKYALNMRCKALARCAWKICDREMKIAWQTVPALFVWD